METRGIIPFPPPYLGSLKFYRDWIARRLEGVASDEAWRLTLKSMTGGKFRVMARTSVAGAHGQPDLVISVALAGGSATSKRLPPSEWRLSRHGRWPEIHMGALAAAYSTTPFYPHLSPAIKEILEGVTEGESFGRLTTALHEACMRFMDLDNLLPELRSLMSSGPTLAGKVCRERRTRLNPQSDRSLLDMLFRYGSETLFLLLPV